MPELPDVELFVRYFENHALNKKIKDVKVFSKKILRNANENELRDHLQNDAFKSAKRYGKWLIIKTEKGKFLAMHFGMTGSLKFTDDDKKPKLTRLSFKFNKNQKLMFVDQRKFGRIEIIKNKDEVIKKHQLGTDALNADWKEFKKLLKKKRGFIKPALMKQSMISGIGNIYADEILFQAGIHPKSKVADLSDKDRKTLYSKMKKVLKTAIDHDAKPKDFPKGYLTSHRKKGKSWKACRGKVKRIKVSGRTSYFCKKVQTK